MPQKFFVIIRNLNWTGRILAGYKDREPTFNEGRFMIAKQNESLSLWMDDVEMPHCPALSENIKCDVCIVGAGIGGLTTAYLLQKEGKNVCILEDQEIGSGQTGRTTAHFSTALDDRYMELEKLHGLKGSSLAAQSHKAAVQKVADIIEKENIECEMDWVDGYLFTPLESTEEILSQELSAVLRAGLSEVSLVAQVPLDFLDTGPALHFPKQIQLHPLKYLKGLSECIIKAGGKIFTRTHVEEVHGGEKAFVKTKDGFTVHADAIVVATNTPINDKLAIHSKQAPYRSYVIALEVPHGSVHKGLYWDTLDPYHFIRLQESKNLGTKWGDVDLLIVGGEDHKTGQNSNPGRCYINLENWARQRFPFAGKMAYKWSGQVMEPVDGLAFLGHNPMDRNNVYVITGDSGNGMTHCTIGGILITDQIMQRPNPWEKLYNPARINFRSTSTFLKENLNVMAQYGDYFNRRPFEFIEDMNWEEGAVFTDGLKQIAAYKNHEGRLELHSAVCTHLGGIVHWNSVEKSWDCPCHGARFNAHGKVIEGPAVMNLKKIDINKTYSQVLLPDIDLGSLIPEHPVHYPKPPKNIVPPKPSLT